MGVGRFLCLGLPFALTLSSLICLSIVITGLHPNQNYYFARFDTKNLSVPISAITKRDFNALDARQNGIAHLLTDALGRVTGTSVASGNNVTASQLGLADYYLVGLWSYCAVTELQNHTSTRVCSKAQSEFYFDPFSIWNLSDTTAEAAINSTTVRSALKTYKTASKWTWVAYIVALVFVLLEIVTGVVSVFSKLASCITSIVSAISTVAVVAASILATVMWSIVVASFNHELNKYGISASVSTKMLAVTWLAAAFSIASGFFWTCTMCCGSTGGGGYARAIRTRGVDNEKLPSGSYQPVRDPAFVSSPYPGAGQPTTYTSPTQRSSDAPEHVQAPSNTAKPSRNMDTAYEPYRAS